MIPVPGRADSGRSVTRSPRAPGRRRWQPGDSRESPARRDGAGGSQETAAAAAAPVVYTVSERSRDGAGGSQETAAAAAAPGVARSGSAAGTAQVAARRRPRQRARLLFTRSGSAAGTAQVAARRRPRQRPRLVLHAQGAQPGRRRQQPEDSRGSGRAWCCTLRERSRDGAGGSQETAAAAGAPGVTRSARGQDAAGGNQETAARAWLRCYAVTARAANTPAVVARKQPPTFSPMLENSASQRPSFHSRVDS